MESGNQEQWRNTRTSLVGNLFDLPLDREQTSVVGIQVPGGQIYLVSWLVIGSWVPHSLARSESVVYSWNLRGLSCPRKELGLVAEYPLKGREAGGVLSEGVLCILGPWEETAPAILIFLAVCLEVTSLFLDLPLSLAVRLWMVTGRQAHSEPLADGRKLSTHGR